jgi:ribosomal-protein-alanine N-acetyltransferase
MSGDQPAAEDAFPAREEASPQDAGPGTVTVRRFRVQDLSAIMAIERPTFGMHAFDPATFLYYAMRHRRAFLAAEEEGEVIGYVMARRSSRANRQWDIAAIAVRKDRRGRGVGTRLMSELLKALRGLGAAVVRLEVKTENEMAQRLYRRFGFVPTSLLRGYYGPDGDGLRMVLRLEPPTRDAPAD